jgi:ferric-dicitrate binding protein FerR (iron transport regulator)
LAGLRVTGAYRTNQIDVMLASLAKVYPIEIKQTNDGRIILKFRRG